MAIESTHGSLSVGTQSVYAYLVIWYKDRVNP